MTTNSLVPTTSAERIQAIDVLRGFALFGILLVNMPFFGWPAQAIITQIAEWNNPLDRLAYGFITLFGESKFFSTFSFLFGFGLFMMMERVEARGGHFVPLYLRRMFALLILGLIHALCFWVGDILVPYAILGTLLLLFRKARPKTLLIWAAVVLAVMALIYLGLMGLLALGYAQPGGAELMAQGFAESDAAYKIGAEQAIQSYRNGTLREILAQHRVNFRFMFAFTPFIMPNIFAMFLLGLYAGRRGIFKDIPAHLPLIRRVQLVGLGLGFAGELISVMLLGTTNLATPTPLSMLRSVIHVFSGPLLALGYIASIVLLLQKESWRARLAPLSYVGRMALSNYLAQTLIATTIFYNYGLGLYAQIGPALGVLLTVAIYSLQIPISLWWMKRFRFGPMEWLWRSLTYLKWQPMRLKPQ